MEGVVLKVEFTRWVPLCQLLYPREVKSNVGSRGRRQLYTWRRVKEGCRSSLGLVAGLGEHRDSSVTAQALRLLQGHEHLLRFGFPPVEVMQGQGWGRSQCTSDLV